MTQLDELAGWAKRLAHEALPTEIEAAVRHAVRDTVGCIVSGATEPAAVSAMRLATRDGTAALDTPERVAVVLGAAAHAHDFDDVQFPTLVHPSCVIVPTALAVARHEPPAIPLPHAIAAGQETSLRVGTALLTADLTNSMLFERGFHPTPVCATLGAAVTAGLLLGLGEDELAHAVGVAASFASGILEGNRTGGTIKPFHAGWAASSGIQAAYAARYGLTGPPTAVEGRFGVLHAFGAAELAERPLGSPEADGWLVPTVFTKPYPTNGFTHPAIEAVLGLRSQGADGRDVERLTVGVARQVLPTIAEPRESKLRPTTPYHARFSGPLTVAMTLRGGGGLGLALSDFPADLLDDRDLLALAERVDIVADDWASGRFPERLSAVAELVRTGGERLTARAETVRGSPDLPLTDDELLAKYRSNVAGRLPDSRLDELLSSDLWTAADLIDAMLPAFTVSP